jgi:preprotein translocase subunit SecE
MSVFSKIIEIMDTIMLYIKESYNELLHKVTWPSLSDLLSSTTVVLIASAIIALCILVMDIISRGVLDNVYKLGI